MSHNKMYRSFIILQEDEKGYSIASDKQVSGYAKIEVKNGKCKISFYAQNIDENKAKCNIVLISGKKDIKKIVNLGEMNINSQGKGEACKEYDDTDIAEANMGYDKITGAAICIMKGNKISCVMCGFMNGEQPKDNWKDYEVLNKIEKSPVKKEEAPIKKKIEEGIVNKDIASTDTDIEKLYKKEEELKKDIQLEEKKNAVLVKDEEKIEDKGNKNISGMDIDGKDIDGKGKGMNKTKRDEEIDEEKVKQYEKVRAEVEEKKRKVSEEKRKLEEMIREIEEAENEIEVDVFDEDDDRHHKKCGEQKHKKEDNCKEKDEHDCDKHKKNHDEKDFWDKLDKICEEEMECKCSKKKEEKPSNKKKHKDESCGCNREDEIEDVEEDEDIETNKFDEYEKEIRCENEDGLFEIRGSVGEFFELLAEDLENVRHKHKEIKYCKWYKVPVPTLDEMCNTNNYNKYTVIYYPMINYYPYIRKYGHFMLGYKCDSNGKMKYIIYGIPGKKDKSEQPYCGKTGFVSWIKDETMGEGMGYWLMFYDFKNSVIVVPME